MNTGSTDTIEAQNCSNAVVSERGTVLGVLLPLIAVTALRRTHALGSFKRISRSRIASTSSGKDGGGDMNMSAIAL